MPRMCFLFCLATFATLLVGCNSSRDGSVVAVEGVVTFEGKPVPGMRISFQPDEGRASAGVTSEDGSFEMFLTRDKKGVQVGLHQVRLNWSPKDEESPLTPEDPVVEDVLAYFEEKGPLEIEIQQPKRDLRIELP